MPQPCENHKARPEVSCHTCFPDEELQHAIARLQSASPPSAPTRKKPRRLDDPEKKAGGKPKKTTWRDQLFGE